MSELVVRRLLFTKFERYMINRQQKPFVLRETETETSSDSDDLNRDKFLDLA